MNRLLPIALVAMLAACDRAEVDEKNASAADVARTVDRSGMKFAPGRWESNVTFVSMDAPGMPAGVARAMQSALGGEQRFATCLSPAQAAKPAADFFAKDAKDCTYDHFTMGSGKIDAEMKCARDGKTVAMAMNGAYDQNSYDMAMDTRIDSGGTGPVTMKMKIASSRVGDCRGDEQAAG
ncbi:MAG: DUF3617 domain-containing protein [Pseudomonadota bacterium]|nr:DUF3617 domain-containing protein [Pseudomonadota bacterium]